MRIGPVIDSAAFSEAERSAMRLDGDCFGLGLTVVAVDALVGPTVRAATLLPATAPHDLVVDTWSAAWVHGVLPGLPNPLTLAVDRGTGRSTRAMSPIPREARFRPGDLLTLGGVRVTSPLKTAFDLLLRHEGDPVATATSTLLLALTGLTGPAAAAAAHAMPKVNGKHRVAARIGELAPPAGAGRARGQPAETRYTS